MDGDTRLQLGPGWLLILWMHLYAFGVSCIGLNGTIAKSVCAPKSSGGFRVNTAVVSRNARMAVSGAMGLTQLLHLREADQVR